MARQELLVTLVGTGEAGDRKVFVLSSVFVEPQRVGDGEASLLMKKILRDVNLNLVHADLWVGDEFVPFLTNKRESQQIVASYKAQNMLHDLLRQYLNRVRRFAEDFLENSTDWLFNSHVKGSNL